jgi:cyclopropane fatty-acyl-phospholipid synthase-like methyltransferase
MSSVPNNWESAYEGTPPWDIGRPQAPIEGLAKAGDISGKVLDIGCGSGEHTLLAASLGLDAVGVDLSARAIEIAKSKAATRELNATFMVGDALSIQGIGEPFDSAIDSGLFHVFDNEDRQRYVETLRRLVAPGGRVFLMCFSDKVPGEWGPRRVSEGELRDSFSEGWEVGLIEASEFEVNAPFGKVSAWLARFARTEEPS